MNLSGGDHLDLQFTVSYREVEELLAERGADVVVWSVFVATPERTKWLPEPERQRILVERHAGEAPPTQGGVGYRGLIRSPSMWGLAISQGCAVYSLYLYLSWLPDYLQTARGVVWSETLASFSSRRARLGYRKNM